MSIKSTKVLLCATMLAATGCVTRHAPNNGIILTSDTKELSGWFNANGEWAVHSTPEIRRYNPYVNNENMRCISVINLTGKLRSQFNYLNQKKVILYGYSVKYDNLSDGKSESDKLLSKKYFNDEVVNNFCLRNYVFIAKDISLYKE